MLLFAAGLAVAATLTTGTGYGRLGARARPHGRRHGARGRARRPSRSWASLPPERANIGSAVNDTTRELGGALGVAIVGSIMSSLYATQLADALADGVPAPVVAAARESLGAAVQIAGVADPAREAFVDAMSRASILVAVVAALGAVIAWRHLPAREAAAAVSGSGGTSPATSPPAAGSRR